MAFQELQIIKPHKKYQIIRANGESEPIILGRNMFKCDDCDKVFARKEQLKRHRKKYLTTRREFECFLCHKP